MAAPENTSKHYAALAGAIAGGVALGFYLGRKVFPAPPTVNQTIDKTNPKIVHAYDIEDITDRKTFCRCWKSKQFPLCDGSHNEHNTVAGDNVGPLVIKHKS